MSTDVLRALRRLIQERQVQARREHKLLGEVVRALPKAVNAAGGPSAKAATKARRKRLQCPRCQRTFAMPMHLGRHIAMSHKKKRRAA
jgi:hypothetical protein